jgi:predicted TIM-barrel fold metal-dependent hydrolase
VEFILNLQVQNVRVANYLCDQRSTQYFDKNAAIEEAVKKALPPSQRDFFVASRALSGPPELEDLGIDRLKHMDAMGIDVQVLSYTTPGTQVLPAEEAVPLARDANDQVASAHVPIECKSLL